MTAAGNRPPPLWLRHDLVVIALAVVLLAVGSLLYRGATRPRMVRFERRGLTFERPAGLLPPRPVPPPVSALSNLGGAVTTAAAQLTATSRYHEVYQSPSDRRSRVEILIDERPEYRSLPMWLQLQRHARYGDLYWTDTSQAVRVRGREWHRTQFKYAYKPTADDAPQVATGVEYATLNGSILYVVTVHGTVSDAEHLEKLVLSTVAVGDAS